MSCLVINVLLLCVNMVVAGLPSCGDQDVLFSDQCVVATVRKYGCGSFALMWWSRCLV